MALLHVAFSFWQMGLDGDVAALSSQGALGAGAGGGEICLSPSAPWLGLEKLHRGARPSWVSSHLLSRQPESAHSDGTDPATDSPDSLGHIPAPPLPP